MQIQRRERKRQGGGEMGQSDQLNGDGSKLNFWW